MRHPVTTGVTSVELHPIVFGQWIFKGFEIKTDIDDTNYMPRSIRASLVFRLRQTVLEVAFTCWA
jgi:hypothetical protein